MKYEIKQYDSGWKHVIKGLCTPYEISKTNNYKVTKSTAIDTTLNNAGMTTVIVNTETGNRQVYSDGEIVFEF